MQKIINGKKYNTETAEQVGFYRERYGRNDFHWLDHWLEETLYKKRTGEFFLFGEGGPASRYCTWIDNHNRTSGEKIVPMTFEEARKWAEKHLEVEEYEAIFGEVEESGEMKGVMYSLPITAIERVKRVAQERRCSASQVIEDLIKTL